MTPSNHKATYVSAVAVVHEMIHPGLSRPSCTSCAWARARESMMSTYVPLTSNPAHRVI